jgi:hypothetical protein
MPGGTIRYVPLHPPKDGATRTSPASEWSIDFDELEKTINSKTRMIVGYLSPPPSIQLLTQVPGSKLTVSHLFHLIWVKLIM